MSVKSMMAQASPMDAALALAWVASNPEVFKQRVDELEALGQKANEQAEKARQELKSLEIHTVNEAVKLEDLMTRHKIECRKIESGAKAKAAAHTQAARDEADKILANAVADIGVRQRELDSFWDNYYNREHELGVIEAALRVREQEVASKEKDLEWSLKKAKEAQEMFERRLASILEASKA